MLWKMRLRNSCRRRSPVADVRADYAGRNSASLVFSLLDFFHQEKGIIRIQQRSQVTLLTLAASRLWRARRSGRSAAARSGTRCTRSSARRPRYKSDTKQRPSPHLPLPAGGSASRTRDLQKVDKSSSAAYPTIPISATGIPIMLEYSLRFTMSQLNCWAKIAVRSGRLRVVALQRD